MKFKNKYYLVYNKMNKTDLLNQLIDDKIITPIFPSDSQEEEYRCLWGNGFSVAAPILWNKLSMDLRTTTSLKSF